MAGKISRAPNRGSEDTAPHPEMAEGGRPRKWAMEERGGRYTARGDDIATSGECVPPLRFRPVDTSMETPASKRRSYRRTLSRRFHCRLSTRIRCNEIPGRTQ